MRIGIRQVSETSIIIPSLKQVTDRVYFSSYARCQSFTLCN